MTEAASSTRIRPARPGVSILPVRGAGERAMVGGISVRGGFGSDLALDPRSDRHFYLLTDRGPNFDTGKPFEKGFADPSFAPSIGRFRRSADGLDLESVFPILGAGGRRLSGLPNPPGEGGTGESPVTWEGRPLPLDRDGIDPEGLVALADGTFWVADEYGPHLLHLDGEGRTIERLNPYGGMRRLPAVFLKRRPNYGLEGLTLTPDGRSLVGVMQAPLENPDRGTAGESRLVRILFFDIDSGRTRQHLYEQEDRGLSTSAIAAAGDDAFFVIEHDGRLPGDRRKPSWIKRVYRIDLSGATDVSDPDDGEHGLLVEGRTLEEMSADELRSAGVTVAPKRLVLDLLALDYPHDKPEGIVVVDGHTLAIVNDDDFGITSGPRGLQEKILPLTGEPDAVTVWLVRLPDLLAPHP